MVELKTITFIFLWVAALIGGVYLYNRYKLTSTSKSNDELIVKKAIATGPKERVLLIQCNNSCYLISNTPVSSTLLDKFPAYFEKEVEEAAS